MSCCGQKRAAASAVARTRADPRSIPVSVVKVPARIAHGDVRVRYLGSGSLSLRGALTGRVYYFAAAGSTAIVDAGDVDPLLRTKLFVRDRN